MLYNTDINELIRFRDHMNKVQEEYLLYDEYTWEIHNSQKKLDEPSLVWSIIKALTNLFILWAIVIFGVQFALYKEWGFAITTLANIFVLLNPMDTSWRWSFWPSNWSGCSQVQHYSFCKTYTPMQEGEV